MSKGWKYIIIVILVTSYVIWGYVYLGPFGSIHKGDLQLVAPPNAENIPVERLIDYVDVRKLDLEIKTSSRNYLNKALRDLFGKSPNVQVFSRITTENFLERRKAYEAKLIEKADSSGLDSMSLRKCLDRIHFRHQKIVTTPLPVSAYLAKEGEIDIWIIQCRWGEGNGQVPSVTRDRGKFFPSLSYYAVWAFRASDQEEIGFVGRIASLNIH